MPQDTTDFHIVLQGREASHVTEAPSGDLLPTAGGNGLPLSITFDEAYASLEKLPMLFIEPDGAFLWLTRGNDGAEKWRLHGCLYDSGKQLQYVELKGHCTTAIWRDILNATGSTMTNAMVQLVLSGRFVSTEQFESSLSE